MARSAWVEKVGTLGGFLGFFIVGSANWTDAQCR
jgi:hypothetical protein